MQASHLNSPAIVQRLTTQQQQNSCGIDELIQKAGKLKLMKFSVSIQSLHQEEKRRIQLSSILESTKILFPNVKIATDLGKIINTCSKQNEKLFFKSSF